MFGAACEILLRVAPAVDPDRLLWEARHLPPTPSMPVWGGIASGVVRFLCRFGTLLLRGGRVPSEPRPAASAIWFYATTKKQARCLQPLAELVPGSWLIEDIHTPPQVAWRQHLLALPFLPWLLVRLLRADPETRQRLGHHFADGWLGYGLTAAWYLRLRRQRPALLVLANDHSLRPRAAHLAARLAGIPTAFVQHAGAGAVEPPLDFDLVCLHGRRSLMVYAAKGPLPPNVYLCGAVLPVVVKTAPPPRRAGCLAFTPGLFDGVGPVGAAIAAVRAAMPALRILLKPHQRSANWPQWQLLADRVGASLAGRQAADAAFFAAVDGIVAGDSYILLEAAALGLPVYWLPPAGASGDQYGFAAEGLFEPLGDVAALLAALRQGAVYPAPEKLRLFLEGWEPGVPPQAAAERIARLLADRVAGGRPVGWEQTSLPGCPAPVWLPR